MKWKTEHDFEKSPATVRAVFSPKNQSVYCIIDNSKRESFNNEGYTVAFYPNRNKDVQTVSLLNTHTNLENAINTLEEKTEEGICDNLS